MSSTLKKNIIFFLLGLLIFETVCTNLYFAISSSISTENPITLHKFQNSRNQSFLSFQISDDKSKFSFKIIGNGGIAEDLLINFCNQKNLCLLPLIFGGKQTIKIYKQSKEILSEQIEKRENRF